jgi:hypothetical protein
LEEIDPTDDKDEEAIRAQYNQAVKDGEAMLKKFE